MAWISLVWKLRDNDSVHFFWGKDQIEDIFWDYPTFKENIEDNEDKEKNQQFKSSVNEILHQTSR